MTYRRMKVFEWILALLTFYGFYLTGAFGVWSALIPPNEYLGWSIIFATTAASRFLTVSNTQREESSGDENPLQGWEKTRDKGMLHFVVVGGPMLTVLLIAVTIVSLQATGLLGKHNSLDVYVIAADVAILAAFYGIRIKEWRVREEQYRASLVSKDAV